MRVKVIIQQAVAPEEDVESDRRDLFEMANLYPDTTGLPMTVWVSPRGNTRHDVRVEVDTTDGNQMNIANNDRRRRPTNTARNRWPTITRRCASRVPSGSR
jgi:hypothetical protein